MASSLNCVFVYISLWGPTAIIGTKPGPHEFEGIIETQHVVLVSGLQLWLGKALCHLDVPTEI